MKNTNYPNWIRSIVSSGLAVAIFATSSMIALAGDAPMGELVISGTANDESSFVMIDGERAYSGRSVNSSSTVTTGDKSATINLGKAGRVELAPNSSLNLNFGETTISGALTSGAIKVNSAAGVDAKIQTKDGVVANEAKNSSAFFVNVNGATTQAASETGVITLNNGKSVTKVGTQDDDDGGIFGMGNGAGIPVAIFGGIVAVAVIYVLTNNNDDNFSGTVSPVR